MSDKWLLKVTLRCVINEEEDNAKFEAIYIPVPKTITKFDIEHDGSIIDPLDVAEIRALKTNKESYCRDGIHREEKIPVNAKIVRNVRDEYLTDCESR